MLQEIKIESIIDGISATQYLAGKNQFVGSVAIDPDLPVDFGSAKVKAGGQITPSTYGVFSGSGLSGAPMWIVTNPKDNKVYIYASDGELISYTAALGSESVIGTPTSGAGNGAAYYNNYLYLATPTDVSRYGPLNGTPSLSNTWWTGTASLTALTNTTYLSRGGVAYPNHAMHAHSDNKLYFADFVGGQGVIHYIKTDDSGGVQGDTNDGSTYNALDLPFGYMPTDIESYGTDLVISAVQTNDSTVRQGKAALFFWDTVSSSFYREVPIQEAVISALLNVNGVLYIFGGNQNNGTVIMRYLGGFSVEVVHFLEEGYAPYPGAVDYYSNRIVWGGNTTFPANSAGVLAMGYKHPQLNSTALHHVANTTSTGSTPVVTAVKYAQQTSGIIPRVVIGWKDGTTQKLERLAGDVTLTSVWRSQTYNIGKPFQIREIRLQLSDTVVENVSIVPKVFVDEDSTSFTLATINDTNYSGKRTIRYKQMELNSNASGSVGGEHNFSLQLTWAGTVHRSVMLPIEIVIDILDD